VPEAFSALVADRFSALVDGAGPVLLAVSGGPDSLAMLDLLWAARRRHGIALEVVHIDHGIGRESHQVAARVAAEAAERGLPCHLRVLELGHGTTETRARAARRMALRAAVEATGAVGVVLAHHADDQVETVMLRVLRGSGPAGLAGMAPKRGIWLRPLLEFPRARLADYLAARGLSGWQDPANADPRHLRSWLRTVALPMLEERLPDLRERLGEMADQAASSRRAWNQVPGLLPALDLADEEGTISVAAPPLRGYRSEVRQAVIAAIARRFGVPLGTRTLVRVEQLLASGRSGTRVRLGRALEAEMAFDRLVLHRPAPPPFAPVELPTEGVVGVGPHRFRLERATATAAAPRREGAGISLMPGAYVVRPWQAGDRIRPLGGTGTRPVVVLLREAKIAAGRRAGWPVMVPSGDDATIVWVPGICRSDVPVPQPGEDVLRVECDLA
jgi:tRNA(Ile)-lysidine synthase